MKAQVGERRRSRRRPVAETAVVRDELGNFIGRGRVLDVSDHGLFVVFPTLPKLPADGRVLVKATLIGPEDEGSCVNSVHVCRIAHCRKVESGVGLGMELLKRIG